MKIVKRIQILFVIITAVCLFTACTSASQKMLTEVQTHLAAEEWQLALDKANNLIELYPDSEEATAAKECAAQALFEGDLKKAFAAADWDRVAEISKEIAAVAPGSKTASDAESAVYEGKTKVLLAELESSYSAGEWQKVIDLSVDLDEAKSHITSRLTLKSVDNDSVAASAGPVSELVAVSKSHLLSEAINAALQNGNAEEAEKLLQDFPSFSSSEIKELKKICTTQLEGFNTLDKIRTEFNSGAWKTVSGYTNVVDSVETRFQSMQIEMPGLIAEIRGMIKQASINYNAEQRENYYKLMIEAYAAKNWDKAISNGRILMGKSYEGSSEAAEAATIVADATEKKAEAKKESARAIIRVTKVEVSRPDSVGGVSLYFNFINNSDKVIKRVNFAVNFYNAVDEVVTCEIARDYTNHCYKTGPYNPGEGLSGYGWSWGKYYNWDIKSAKLCYLNVEFMDGTSRSFDSEEIGYVQY